MLEASRSPSIPAIPAGPETRAWALAREGCIHIEPRGSGPVMAPTRDARACGVPVAARPEDVRTWSDDPELESRYTKAIRALADLRRSLPAARDGGGVQAGQDEAAERGAGAAPRHGPTAPQTH